jgi:hypothetical protein
VLPSKALAPATGLLFALIAAIVMVGYRHWIKTYTLVRPIYPLVTQGLDLIPFHYRLRYQWKNILLMLFGLTFYHSI